MPNPFTNLISDDFVALWRNAITEVIRGASVPCTLYFQSAPEICPNCVYSPSSMKSANIYKAGGPYPFPNGSLCPFCKGEGKITREVTRSIDLLVIYKPENWVHIGEGNVVRAPGSVQTLSSISTYATLSRAKDILFNTDLEGLSKAKHERDGIPSRIGLGEDAFILTIWRLKQT